MRAIQIKGGPVQTAVTIPVQILLKDPFSHDLANDFVPVLLYLAPTGGISIVNAVNPLAVIRSNPLPVVLEPEVQCPAGSCWWLSIRNPSTSVADLTQFRILFQGVKRRIREDNSCAS